MFGRVVEVTTPHRHVSVTSGFLVIRESRDDRREVGRVPVSDIESVMLSNHAVSISNDALVRLAGLSVPVVAVDPSFNPAGIFVALHGNYEQGKRFDAQIAATLPTRKRLWAQVVRAKINQQAVALEAVGRRGTFVRELAGKVRSGDPENLEARAARMYWQRIFGTSFGRHWSRDPRNALLNYGYAVLRATVARAVVQAGLHPTLGIHHRHENNPFRLVDDLMEPFRPFVDLRVVAIARTVDLELSRDNKLSLVEVMSEDLEFLGGTTPIGLVISSVARSLAGVYLGESRDLVFPQPQVPARMLSDIESSDPRC